MKTTIDKDKSSFWSLFILVLFLVTLIGCGGGDGDNGDAAPANTEPLVFQYPPVDLDKVEFIQPMGGMFGNHVTPIDHQYYVASDFGAANEMEIDVYSPAGGTITSIQHMGSFNAAYQDYRLVIQHTEAVSSVFIHIDNLSEKIMAFAPTEGGYVNTNIAVVSGEVIGNYTGSVDYNVVDNNITLTGFVVPESYVAESWKRPIPRTLLIISQSPSRPFSSLKVCGPMPPLAGKLIMTLMEEWWAIGSWKEQTVMPDSIPEIIG